ncbi:MAG: hypothetical protein ACE14L_14320 [Terriglobales bacterium]
MSEVIYVPLLDEGTDCWRPVHAEHVRDDVYEITVDREPKGERWQYPPHALVRCREHMFQDGAKGLIAFERINNDRGT